MRRLDFVDSLRGIAALYVVAFHTALIPNPALAVPHWAQEVVLNGGTAVTLFFVVSAFSLCHTMRSRDGKTRPAREFYVRRLFRIAPLFYAMLALTASRDVLTFGAWHSAWSWAKCLFFIFNFFPGSETGIVWASWTIGVEMAFYAIFPLLFAQCTSLSSLAALAFAALLAAAGFGELVLHLPVTSEVQASFFQFSVLRHLPVFIVGMMCWFIYDRYVEGREYAKSIGAALILGSLWAYYAYLHGALNLGFPDIYYQQALLYSALLIGLAILPSPIFVNRVTLLAGRISYSIYLLHPPIVFFLIPVYRRIYGLGLPVSVSFPLCLGVTLGVVTLAAMLTYRWIELPGMALGKRFLARGRAAPVPIVAAENSV
jgi:peptidoglycan/LPS O-acetylase OafA/YrhL